METLVLHVFKDSFGPILELLNEHKVKYQMHMARAGTPMAASQAIELILHPAMWGALATIVVVFVKAKHGRKVTITTKEDEIFHAEGLTKEELEPILKRAKNLVAVDTKPERTENENG